MSWAEIIAKGFSNPAEVRAGMVNVDDALSIERAWYKNAERYPDHASVLAAVACDKLVAVKPDENIQLIGRLRNPDLEEDFPAYLLPAAARNMTELGERWRAIANDAGVSRAIRLAATSLVRTQARQDMLVESGKFAVPDSTHVTGGAYDFDLKGYYLRLADGSEATVSQRPLEPQIVMADAFHHQYGVHNDPPQRLGPEEYDPRVTIALLLARKHMLEEGLLAGIVEMPSTLNASLHTAAIPLETTL